MIFLIRAAFDRDAAFLILEIDESRIFGTSSLRVRAGMARGAGCDELRGGRIDPKTADALRSLAEETDTLCGGKGDVAGEHAFVERTDRDTVRFRALKRDPCGRN